MVKNSLYFLFFLYYNPFKNFIIGKQTFFSMAHKGKNKFWCFRLKFANLNF